jgi:hypothetical protein
MASYNLEKLFFLSATLREWALIRIRFAMIGVNSRTHDSPAFFGIFDFKKSMQALAQ